MEVFDFKTDNDGDIAIADGDLVIAESTLQHQRDIIISEKGDYKQWPALGVGIVNYINEDADANDLQTAIQSELRDDGIEISKLRINSFSEVIIEGEYAKR